MKRFWDKVEKSDNCWNWIAGSRGSGYGAFKYLGKVYDSHRFVWMLTYGKMPEKWILHKCANRLCVNPEHLYNGTPQQNYWDMRKSGNAYIAEPKYSPDERVRINREKWLKYWHKKGKYLRDAKKANAPFANVVKATG